MAQWSKWENSWQEPETAPSPSTKIEVVDFVEEQYASLSKRFKASPIAGASVFSVPPPQHNPFHEPRPLGLQLRKTPSLLDLVQMKLIQGRTSSAGAAQSEYLNQDISEGASVAGTNDKLKASNFPASLLRIGNWVYKSTYEGDLVAKCYFAKHKLVWEVLEGGLKSKIEIQWSDIMALKANCPHDGPGTMTVVLASQPRFFRETNPLPKKHTLWRDGGDFTDGQASIYREHFLEVPQGLLLNKNFKKLIQCDTRLNYLSQQPKIVLDSPYFESGPSISKEPEECKGHGFSKVEVVVTPTLHASSFNIEQQTPSEHWSLEGPSPSLDARATERNGNFDAVSSKILRNSEQMKAPALQPSKLTSDLVNHIGNYFPEKITAGDHQCIEDGSECDDILDNLSQRQLGDALFATAADERPLMSRINSLNSPCCLLGDSASAQNLQMGTFHEVRDSGNNIQHHNLAPENHPSIGKIESSVGDEMIGLTAGMLRKESLSDLLLNLPRVSSFPLL